MLEDVLTAIGVFIIIVYTTKLLDKTRFYCWVGNHRWRGEWELQTYLGSRCERCGKREPV